MRTVFHIGAIGSLEKHVLDVVNKNVKLLSESRISWLNGESIELSDKNTVKSARCKRSCISTPKIEAHKKGGTETLLLTNQHILSSPDEIFSTKGLYTNARAASAFIDTHFGDTDLYIIFEIFPVVEVIDEIRNEHVIDAVAGRTEAELISISWVNVLEDIRAGCPGAKILVLDRRYSSANIIGILRQLLALNDNARLVGEFGYLRDNLSAVGVTRLNKLISSSNRQPRRNKSAFVELLGSHRRVSQSSFSSRYDLSDNFERNSQIAFEGDLGAINKMNRVWVY